MTTPLDPMRQLIGTGALQPAEQSQATGADAARTADGKSFGDLMNEFVNQADHAQKNFDSAIQAVENGEVDNLHRLMIAQNEAQLSLRLAAEVRNKLVEAYREVMRSQF